MDNSSDEYFMGLALEQARLAFEAGEVPIGAVAVMNNEVIAQTYNQVEENQLATSHAELLIINKVSKIISNWRLEDIEIYVTKEPCAMCAGALVNARVKRVIYGMSDPRSGGTGSALDITGFPGMLHNVIVQREVLDSECKELIQKFFKQVRKR